MKMTIFIIYQQRTDNMNYMVLNCLSSQKIPSDKDLFIFNLFLYSIFDFAANRQHEQRGSKPP